MSTTPAPIEDRGEPLHAIPNTVAGLISGVGAFFGTFDRFGFAGGWFFVGLAMIVLGLGHALPKYWTTTKPWMAKMADGLKRFGSTARWYFAIGFSLIVIALIASALGIARFRLFRLDFTKSHSAIAVEHIDFADAYFQDTQSKDVNEQFVQERRKLTNWIRWMTEGANRGIKLEQQSGETEKVEERLIVIQGAQFTDNFDTLPAFVAVNASLDIQDAFALLVKQFPGHPSEHEARRPWYKPEMRQMFPEISASKKSVSISLTNPNRGEYPLFFLLVKHESPGRDLPAKDQLLATNSIGVRK